MFQRSSALGWIVSVLSRNIWRRSVLSKPAAPNQAPCRRYTVGSSYIGPNTLCIDYGLVRRNRAELAHSPGSPSCLWRPSG